MADESHTDTPDKPQPLKLAVAPAQDSKSRIARARLAVDNAITQVSDEAKLQEIAEGLTEAAKFIRAAAGLSPASTGPKTEYISSVSS